VALDAKTGKVVWDTTVADAKQGYYFTLAPLVAKGKVMVGTSGGELGIRGFIAAFDAQTGKEVWKTFSVAAVVKPPLYMFFSAIPDAVTPGHNGSGTFLWCGDPAQSDLSTYITSFLNSPSPGSSSQ